MTERLEASKKVTVSVEWTQEEREAVKSLIAAKIEEVKTTQRIVGELRDSPWKRDVLNELSFVLSDLNVQLDVVNSASSASLEYNRRNFLSFIEQLPPQNT